MIKKIPGFNYWATSEGEILNEKGEMLVQHLDGRRGYLKCRLKNNGKWDFLFTHQLIALAFLGICPEGKEVNHKDGNKKNSKPVNLEYITRSENAKHAILLGLRSVPSAAKLTQDEVEQIKEIGKSKTQEEIAQQFNIHSTVVSKILSGKIWK